MIHEIVICLKKIVPTWRYRNSVKLRSKQSKQYDKVWVFDKLYKLVFIIFGRDLCTKYTKMKEIGIPKY